ncbi:beta-secretase 1-like, partial [Convolutriloba macropyga]|uniref:beta-secretase 1-like n=1 Tax=Convolutriloba macropyga TaxID=536237 RepID=UPI003F520F2B
MFKRIFIALSAVIGLLNSCDCTLLANDPNEPILHFYNIPLTGIIDEGYSASIDIGTPAQTFNILIDTGSSNLAVAGVSDYVSKIFLPKESETFKWQDDRISVQYSQGYWQGELAKDQVKFSALPNRPISAKFVVIDYSEYFFVQGTTWQGILGLGYQSIAEQNLEPFWVSYIREHNFEDVFSLALCGLVSKAKVEEGSTNDTAQGTLTLGGADPKLSVGEMRFTPIVRSTYFEVVITDFKVNGESLRMDCKEYNFPRTIVDSGTTNLRLPKRVYDEVVARLKQFAMESMMGDQGNFWGGDEVVCWEEGHDKFSLFPTISLSLLDVSSTHSVSSYFE